MYGAGRLIMERLCDSGSNMLTISDEGESNDLFLLPDGFRMWISLVRFRLLVRLLLQRNSEPSSTNSKR